MSTLLSISILLFLASFSSAMDIFMVDYKYDKSSAWRTDEEVKGIYEQWLAKHDKFYNDLVEYKKRFEIFKDNLKFIDEHNSENRTYKVGLNQFSDLTDEEYRAIYLGTRSDPMHWLVKSRNDSQRYAFQEGDKLPALVDWRAKGAVNPIRNQGKCGSCWAFSAIASVEAINQIRTGKLIKLSEQELVDCDTASKGCKSGRVNNAFQYIKRHGGVDTEKNYPYKAVKGQCKSDRKKVVSINGYSYVRRYNEKALQKAVAYQPISVAIDSSSKAFRHYKSGIFNGECGTKLDHAVVIVGYGTEKGKDYWIVRNSWGKNWGEKGYVRMQRNVPYRGGKCGIAMDAWYPIKNGKSKSNLETSELLQRSEKVVLDVI